MHSGQQSGSNYGHKIGPYGDSLVPNKNYPPDSDNSQMIYAEYSDDPRNAGQEQGARSYAPYHQQEDYSYAYRGKGVEGPHRPNLEYRQTTMQQSFETAVPFAAGNPLMADMAAMYGSRIMDTGKEIVDKEINKYVSLNRIKYYFAVDTSYTLNKLKLLLFPYNHKSWAPILTKGQPTVPKEDLNAPDMYIPLMAIVTYILLAGYVIAIQNRFSPELLGVLATQTLAYVLIELGIQFCLLYVTNLHTCLLTTLDLLAFSGYKFVGVIIVLLMNRILNGIGYFLALIYCGFSLTFFMVRSLKWRLVSTTMSPYNTDMNGEVADSFHSKRRVYFMLVGLSQAVLICWFSCNLESYNTPANPS